MAVLLVDELEMLSALKLGAKWVEQKVDEWVDWLVDELAVPLVGELAVPWARTTVDEMAAWKVG